MRQLTKRAVDVITQALVATWPMVDLEVSPKRNATMLAQELVLWLEHHGIITEWRPRVWWDDHDEPQDRPNVVSEDDHVWTYSEQFHGWLSDARPAQVFQWPELLEECGLVVEVTPGVST